MSAEATTPPGFARAEEIAREHGLLLERAEHFSQVGDSVHVGASTSPPEVRIVEGTGNTVLVGSRTHASKALVLIKGSNNLVVIGAGARLGGGKVEVIADDTVFWFGAQSSADVLTAMPRERQRIIVGDDCLFSARILLETSDHHPIFDVASGERVNAAGSILIGNHVWLGRDVHVSKGAVIGSGSVVGSRSTVTGSKCAQRNSVFAGTPAKLLREGVQWAHQKADRLEDYEASDYAAARAGQRAWIAARSIEV